MTYGIPLLGRDTVCKQLVQRFRWDEERRFLLRCELDAAYFRLYLGSPAQWGTDSPQLLEMFPTPRDAVDYIMETFPIVKRKDIKRTAVLNESGEVVQQGTYITKTTILTIYDEMQQAIETGIPYQTRAIARRWVICDTWRAGFACHPTGGRRGTGRVVQTHGG